MILFKFRQKFSSTERKRRDEFLRRFRIVGVVEMQSDFIPFKVEKIGGIQPATCAMACRKKADIRLFSHDALPAERIDFNMKLIAERLKNLFNALF